MYSYICIFQGRNGLGAIYTWAAGNGGQNFDDCNADGFVTSPYTIAVTSLASSGGPAIYSEPCSSILCATYGGDSTNGNTIVSKTLITRIDKGKDL